MISKACREKYTNLPQIKHHIQEFLAIEETDNRNGYTYCQFPFVTIVRRGLLSGSMFFGCEWKGIAKLLSYLLIFSSYSHRLVCKKTWKNELGILKLTWVRIVNWEIVFCTVNFRSSLLWNSSFFKCFNKFKNAVSAWTDILIKF